ncbi:hypothetical protein WJX72_000963 [[Myrmecia] bisecta]|uniref:Uncharacterized protein n=1 Tax=[Myrmecia] bisecta TaxID=41462 RepID=A0AAW1PWT9_9CHLO
MGMGPQAEFLAPLEGAYVLYNGRKYQRTSAVVFCLMGSWSAATVVKYLPPPYNHRRLLILALCTLIMLWDAYTVRFILAENSLRKSAEHTRAVAFIVNSTLAMTLVILCKASELPLMDVPLFHIVLNAVLLWALNFRGITAQRLQLVMLVFAFWMLCSQWLFAMYNLPRFVLECLVTAAVTQLALVANARRDTVERKKFLQDPSSLAALHHAQLASHQDDPPTLTPDVQCRIQAVHDCTALLKARPEGPEAAEVRASTPAVGQ